LSITANPIEEYEDVRAVHEKYLMMNGAQAGDPDKAAASIIKIVSEETPPLYFLLGGDAYNRALNKLDALYSEIHKWEEMTCATDFDY
jgi:hypothetical protein